jgi:hypothetical protein
MMLRGSPASPCSRSKGCARRPAAATTPSNKQSGLSSETDSGRCRHLRRRRNELEYPHLPADTATSEEAEQAAGTAHCLITVAGRLLPQLAFFSQTRS